MERLDVLLPHDIVKLAPQSFADSQLPAWVKATQLLYGTVRRGTPENKNSVLVGLRGEKRNQRFGCELSKTQILAVSHPWELTDKHSFRQEVVCDYPAYQLYQTARQQLFGCRWGVGGSLGFELATDLAALRPGSDLDLLLYTDTKADLPDTAFQKAPDFFEKVDIQVITAKGGFSLKEYLRAPDKKILLKTNQGPILTRSIW